MIRKLIFSILFVLSTAIIILYVLTLDALAADIGVGFSLSDFFEMLGNQNQEENTLVLSLMAYTMLEIFGIPLTLLSISILGLTIPNKQSS